jgi:folylpolyglutamate synthase/dihydropteroate synthase
LKKDIEEMTKTKYEIEIKAKQELIQMSELE